MAVGKCLDRAEQTLIYAEAVEAAPVVERQLTGLDDKMRWLGQRLSEMDPPVVVTCARESSDHAATFAKYPALWGPRKIDIRSLAKPEKQPFIGREIGQIWYFSRCPKI